MNIYDRITDILMESFLNEGLMRRQRVAAAMNRKLHGNQSQVNPDDPNLQEPGANTPQGKEIYTSSERQSANAKVGEFHKKAASAEERRGERIRGRIVQGGKGLKRMAAGAQRGNPVSPEQKAANKEIGGVAKTSPMDVLRRSRELQARSQQQGDNASNVARGIRHNARNLAREKRGLPVKSRYSSRAPVGEQLPESVIMTYDRIINLMLESRIEGYLDRLDESRVDELRRIERDIKAGKVSKQTADKYNRARRAGKTDPTSRQRKTDAIKTDFGNNQKWDDDRGSSPSAQQTARGHDAERKERVAQIGTGRFARSQAVRRDAKGKNNPDKKYVEPSYDAPDASPKKPKKPQLP